MTMILGMCIGDTNSIKEEKSKMNLKFKKGKHQILKYFSFFTRIIGKLKSFLWIAFLYYFFFYDSSKAP